MKSTIKESHVLRQCLDYLKAKGVTAWRSNNIAVPKGDGTFRRFNGMRGLSDILCIIPPCGTILAVECKRPGGKQSEDQKNFQKSVESCGGMYVLADSVDVLIDFFRRLYAGLDL